MASLAHRYIQPPIWHSVMALRGLSSLLENPDRWLGFVTRGRNSGNTKAQIRTVVLADVTGASSLKIPGASALRQLWQQPHHWAHNWAHHVTHHAFSATHKYEQLLRNISRIVRKSSVVSQEDPLSSTNVGSSGRSDSTCEDDHGKSIDGSLT